MTTTDPRSKNEWFNTQSAATYLQEYAAALQQALGKVSAPALEKAIAALDETSRRGGHVYSIGNGGSASIADHLCCDFTKGTFVSGQPPLKSHSLAANGAMLTALANDFSFNESFSRQVEMLMTTGDLLIAVSSSGNSQNIINAVEVAKAKKIPVIGLSGFSGGALAKAADINLHVPVSNYGVVEDCHQSLMHVMAQMVFLRRQK